MTDMTELTKRAGAIGIVPVLTIHSITQVLPLVQAVLRGGLDIVEVTLRTDCAAKAIETIARSGLNALVGAGTIMTRADITTAERAGADFLVTPGTPEDLVAPLRAFKGPVIPGAATATEIMALRKNGYTLQKFFPAAMSGGPRFLQTLAGPIPDVTYMPTGGIDPGTMADYLHLPHVLAVGGSWIATRDDMIHGRWPEIEAKARMAVQLAQAAKAQT